MKITEKQYNMMMKVLSMRAKRKEQLEKERYENRKNVKYECKECWEEKSYDEMKTDRCCNECWKPYMKDFDYCPVDSSEYLDSIYWPR